MSAPQPTPKPRLRSKHKLAGTLALGVVVLGALGGFVWTKLSRIGGHGHPGDPTPRELIGLLNPDNDRAQFPGHSRVNVLLIGKDYNRDRKGMPSTKDSRSDTIIMLSLDFDSGKVSALSIPRDTRVTASDGVTGKLNGTYAHGGAKLLRETVGTLLGVTPDYVLSEKDNAIKAVVDKLGGVDVESLDAMNYDDNWGQLHIHLPKGKMTVNGEQAVGFVRFREVKPGTRHSLEEGDTRRMARQMQLIRAMAAKGKTFGNLFQLDEIANTALGQVETDLTRSQELGLVLYFRKIQPEDIESASLPGKGTTHGTYFFMPDPRKKADMVSWLLKGDQAAADRLTVVAVENASGTEGAAPRVTAALRAGGFDAQDAGEAAQAAAVNPAPANPPLTQIVYSKPALAARAGRIAKLLGLGTGQVIREKRADTTGVFRLAKTDRADVRVLIGQDLAPLAGERSAQL